MIMPDAIDREPSGSSSNVAERKPYLVPELKTLGDVVDLTQAEYGGLDQQVYGYLFAMASPSGLPGPPPR